MMVIKNKIKFKLFSFNSGNIQYNYNKSIRYDNMKID